MDDAADPRPEADDDRELWFTPGRHAFFLIPRSLVVPEGALVLRAVRGGRKRMVEEEGVAPYQISGDEAVTYLREDLHLALDLARDTLRKAAGGTAEQARHVREDFAHLEEQLTGALSGFGERLTGALRSPVLARALDEVGDRLKHVAAELERDPADDPDADGPGDAP